MVHEMLKKFKNLYSKTYVTNMESQYQLQFVLKVSASWQDTCMQLDELCSVFDWNLQHCATLVTNVAKRKCNYVQICCQVDLNFGVT